jgi:hypothetical protein
MSATQRNFWDEPNSYNNISRALMTQARTRGRENIAFVQSVRSHRPTTQGPSALSSTPSLKR